jgi:hypothetical protein
MKVAILTSCLLAFLFTFSTQTFAVDITVNLTTDENDADIDDGSCDIDLVMPGSQCTLPAAIAQANNLTSNDRILFNLPANSTITLIFENGGEIAIGDNGTLEIVGTSANNLTIDGGAGENRIFYVFTATVTISGVTLTGGNGTDIAPGGAIFADSGSLTFDRVHITGNTGGGVYFSGGRHRIINSTFSGNNASDGAGFYNQFGELTIVNSTISGNTASNVGGGFYNTGNVTLRNATITNNTAISSGGISHAMGTLNIGNTIVAGNNASGGTAPEIGYGGGTITSAGGNLFGDSTNTGTFPITYQPTDKRNINPLLGVRQNNGGTTPTHALLAGSPAIDAGLNALAVDPFSGNALEFDQRGAGFPRIVNGNSDGTTTVDIGAYEAPIGTTQSAGFEADVNPRPSQSPNPSPGQSGDGRVTSGDVTQVRRFVLGLDTPDAPPNTSNEFQKADSAPFSTRGDGRVTSGDVTQARRYALGLDSPQPAGGPVATSSTPQPMTAPVEDGSVGGKLGEQLNGDAPQNHQRTVTPFAVSRTGNVLTVGIVLNTNAGETLANSLSFTLNFNTAELSNPTNIRLGSGGNNASLGTNESQILSGRLGILLDLPPTNTSPPPSANVFGPGRQQLVLIDFTVAAGATTTTLLSFGDSPTPRFIADTRGNRLDDATTFMANTVSVNGPTAAGVSISGRIRNSSGAGLSGVAVSLLDTQSGRTQTTVSGADGSYRFENVEVGGDYVITPRLERYTFSPGSKQVSLVEELTETDFVATSKKTRRRL